jgi:hypothetical protein
MNRGGTPEAHLRAYLVIIQSFLDSGFSAGELKHAYQEYFLSDPEPFDRDSSEYQALHVFFLDCGDFMENPEHRRPRHSDEAEFHRRALWARDRILALIG